MLFPLLISILTTLTEVQVNIIPYYSIILLSFDPFQLILHSIARVNFLKCKLDHIFPLLKILNGSPLPSG